MQSAQGDQAGMSSQTNKRRSSLLVSTGRSITAVAILLSGGAVTTALAPAASAKPVAPAAFCATYPQAKGCESGFAECTTCHTIAPARNAYGAQISERLSPGGSRPLADSDFLKDLPGVLRAIERLDADGDGHDNMAEILAGTKTADRDSFPRIFACADTQVEKARGNAWNVCGYDPVYAFRKVRLDFCGMSPTRAQTDAFKALLPSEQAWKAGLTAALEECLDSRYWLGVDGVVWNIGNAKIRPTQTVKSGRNPGPVQLGDFEDDFNLFAWGNSDDRDVREILTAQYYVRRVSDDPVKLEVIPEEELAKRGRQTSQNVPQDKRAGLITTRWVAAVNTMFTAIPRTTAAQAYRAFLGFDIAKMQGLMPVAHEPVDYDAKGVAAAECAACHSTLDPATYPFTRYNGIGRYNYDPNRLQDFVRTDGERVVEAPKSGVLLGQKVEDLVDWGRVAANSEPFARKVVADYWKVLVGRDPLVQDQAEYSQLWQGLMNKDVYNYRVEKMLHGLIFTSAYGRP
jgi:hypothetical protein